LFRLNPTGPGTDVSWPTSTGRFAWSVGDGATAALSAALLNVYARACNFAQEEAPAELNAEPFVGVTPIVRFRARPMLWRTLAFAQSPRPTAAFRTIAHAPAVSRRAIALARGRRATLSGWVCRCGRGGLVSAV
jgi:hypothetical protein